MFIIKLRCGVFGFAKFVLKKRVSFNYSTMVQAKKIVMAKRFDGFPKESDFKLETEELPALKDGEILLEALFLSVDPYMRAWAGGLKPGDTMIGGQIAKVTESKNPGFPVGCNVLANVGWRSHSISNGERLEKVPEYPPGVPLSLALGTLGMPGRTASAGMLKVCRPKAGEIVVVSSGAGAVGNVAGQLAKIQGCTVIGYAGSEEKVNFMKEIGFDHAFNYKQIDLDQSLKSVAPDGVDCYFDTVGGSFSSVVRQNLRDFGRVAVCGATSQFNRKEPELIPDPQQLILRKKLRIEGFAYILFDAQFKEEFTNNLIKYVKDGQLKYRETVTNGFEKMPKAFLNLLSGNENIGKAIIKA